jgi:hypothetical protein
MNQITKSHFICLGLFLILFFSSCCSFPTNEELYDKYLDKHKSIVYANQGPPDRITSDGGTGEILIYSSSNTVTEPGYAVRSRDGRILYYTKSTERTTTHRTMFYIDSNGFVYQWKTD